MLKYEKIVGSLSSAQKMRLLCDISALSSGEYDELGVPLLSVADMNMLAADYPTPAEMARSWSPSLVREAAGEVMSHTAKHGTSLFLTPPARPSLTPYGSGLSEDAVLSSAMAGEYLGAAEERSLYAAIKGFSLSAKDTEWLDEKPDGRFICEQVIGSYLKATQKGTLSGISAAQDIQAKNYEKANSALLKMASRHKYIGEATRICENADAKGTVRCIRDGVICLKADFSALSIALNKYYQMKKAADRGDLSEGEIERSIEEYRALSPELIDEAVDRVIDLSFKASKMKKKLSAEENTSKDSTALRAASETVVLLKNSNKILPLSKGKSTCIIGDTAISECAENFASDFALFLGKGGYKVIGTHRGYELDKDRNEKFLASAVKAACGADTVIVFLGMGKKRELNVESSERLSLPANQVALLDELGKAKCKVIAVISGDYPADIVLEEKTDAIIFSPIGAKYSAEALANIISGAYSPCGKLTRTVYTDSDRILKKQAICKKRGMKTGPFIGYKYYDSADFYPKYAFGHGLSYAKFAYSSTSVSASPKGASVTFKIKNRGKMRAAEVAQVYVGIQSSSVVRPKKELCAFEKIELEAGESKTVTIHFSLPKVFDTESGEFAEEAGTYNIYIGSSVRDIRLMCSVYSGDAKIKPDGEKADKYLLSESNIISDNYKLEADCKIMKKSVLNIIAGIAALLLAVVLKVYCLSTDINALFFDIIALILAASAWAFFIAEAVSRRKASKADKSAIAAANEEAFKTAEELEISAAEQLFAKEFDIAYSEAEAPVSETHTDAIEADNMMHINGELNLAIASRELSEAAKEKGVDLSESDAGKLFASLLSSRVLLLHGMGSKAFEAFMQVLAHYFETAVYKDNVGGAYSSPENILFAKGADGSIVKTNAMIGIEEAHSAPEKVHLLGFDGVNPLKMGAWFAHIAKHAKNPYAHHSFKAHNEQNVETVQYFPQNVWFVVNLTESASYAEIPANAAETATLNNFVLRPCEAEGAVSAHHSFTYYQMEYLCDKLVSAMNIGENVWKRFDRLEAFVNSHVPFTFGNKLWLCVERYIAASVSCGKENEKSIDECLAAKLLPVIIVALNGKIAQGEASLTETLENIFGEDHITACKKVIKSCGADIV